jgi:hypothetical protein
MKLTKIQLKLLKVYARYHSESLTVGGMARVCWRSWLVLLLLAALASWLNFWGGWTGGGWVCIGMCFGAILRDVGRFQVLLRTWPALHEVISWERVSELIESNEKKRRLTNRRSQIPTASVR